MLLYLLTAMIGSLSFSSNAAAAEDISTTEKIRSCGDIYGPLISSQIIHSPIKESESEAEIGQSMISSTYNIHIMEGVRSLSYVFNQEITFTGKYAGTEFDVTVPRGKSDTLLKGASAAYKPNEFTFKYRNESSPRGSFTRPDLTFSLDTSTEEIVANLAFGFIKRSFQINQKAIATPSEKCTIFGADSLKRELVYSGVSQGTISLLYREFQRDMARPAFSQDLRYDLREGEEIGYKGARFKVTKAGNTGIKYTVLKYLD